jgi:hypothetical protein
MNDYIGQSITYHAIHSHKCIQSGLFRKYNNQNYFKFLSNSMHKMAFILHFMALICFCTGLNTEAN